MNDDVIGQFFGNEKGIPADHRCGYVAIVGRPNVGKSTLLNHVLGQKLSITSRKPQTTRHRIVGVLTRPGYQMLFVDTPGIHKVEPKAINRYMNRAASSTLRDVDVVLFVVDGNRWTDEDELVLGKLQGAKVPVFLVINKMDRLENKDEILPHVQQLSSRFPFTEIIPVSALRGQNLDRLEEILLPHLPIGVPLFAEDQLTDRSQRFLAAEIVREKIMRQLGEEIPYELTVEIEQFKQEGRLLRINALILVERDGQKAIVIGERGQRLKRIGQEARLDMEKLFDSKVMLELWVKVKGGWSDDERALKSLGYTED